MHTRGSKVWNSKITLMPGVGKGFSICIVKHFYHNDEDASIV
jgi:hypothetical protein